MVHVLMISTVCSTSSATMSRFNVIYFSSEDEEYPASELNMHSPETRGWQSFRYCEYPQELGFEIEGGVAKLAQVQILSHQSKISTKLEIFIGNGADYHSAKFKRLGFLSLDSNERSGYRARELKTVYVEAEGRYIRFIIHKCFLNKYNIFQQVGIVAVNFMGTENPDAGKHRGPARGSAQTIEAPMKGQNALTDLTSELNLDPQTANKLRLLSEAKVKAVSAEDYATAKQIKLVEKEISALGVELAQLDIAKQQAVKAEDYDRAMLLKNETDELRAEIEEKVCPQRFFVTRQRNFTDCFEIYIDPQRADSWSFAGQCSSYSPAVSGAEPRSERGFERGRHGSWRRGRRR